MDFGALGAESARRAADEGLLGDDVVGVAGVDLGDAEDGRVHRLDFARNDRDSSLNLEPDGTRRLVTGQPVP
jgi:hypothetical protein